jgi:hypothetical protein
MNRLDTVAQMLYNNITKDLMHVTVPADDIKHALKGSNTFVPTHAIHQRSKPTDPGMVPNLHRFGHPTSIPRQHRRQEE